MQLLFSDAELHLFAMLSFRYNYTVVFYCLSTNYKCLILQGINQMTTPLKMQRFASYSFSISFIMLMFKWGIYSIVIGNVIFSFSMCLLNSRAIERTVGYHQETKKTFIIPSIAAVVMGIITFTIHLLLDVFMGGKIATLLSILVAIIVFNCNYITWRSNRKRNFGYAKRSYDSSDFLKKVHLLKRGAL